MKNEILKQFIQRYGIDNGLKDTQTKKNSSSSDSIRFLKLSISIIVSVLLIIYCIENEGWVGTIIYQTQSVLLGDVRFIIPIVILIQAVLKFKFKDWKKRFGFINILPIICFEICVILAFWGNGGILGQWIYYVLAYLFGDLVTMMILFMILILSIAYIIYITPYNMRIENPLPALKTISLPDDKYNRS